MLLSRLPFGLAKVALAGTALAAIFFGSAGCRSDQGDASGRFPRSETLYVGGRQWGEPASFNPLISSPDWPVNGTNLLYEYLLFYDPQTGKMVPLLADSAEVRDGEVEVVMNPAARWNDGKPVTGWDVKYTYDLGQKYKGVPVSPLWNYITEVKLSRRRRGAVPATRGVRARQEAQQPARRARLADRDAHRAPSTSSSRCSPR